MEISKNAVLKAAKRRGLKSAGKATAKAAGVKQTSPEYRAWKQSQVLYKKVQDKWERDQQVDLKAFAALTRLALTGLLGSQLRGILPNMYSWTTGAADIKVSPGVVAFSEPKTKRRFEIYVNTLDLPLSLKPAS